MIPQLENSGNVISDEVFRVEPDANFCGAQPMSNAAFTVGASLACWAPVSTHVSQFSLEVSVSIFF